MIETEMVLPCGRMPHVYDTATNGLPVLWHHGTPNIGTPPRPLFRDDIRRISYDRPGYGGSTPLTGRNMASVAMFVTRVADTLGIDRFGALLPDRVLAVVSVAGPAPFNAEGLDWFEGMSAGCEASLRAAAEGREAKEKYQASAEFDPAQAAAPGGY